MRFAIALFTLLATASVSACSSAVNGTGRLPSSQPGSSSHDFGTSSAPDTGTPAPTDTGSGASSGSFCTDLKQALEDVSQLPSKMSDPSQAKPYVTQEAKAFADLAGEAPTQIKPAVQDMATALEGIAEVLDNPSSGDAQTKLQQVLPKLSADGQQMGQYIATNCS